MDADGAAVAPMRWMKCGKKQWSEEHHLFFQVRFTERLRFKRLGVVVPWIFLLFIELTWKFEVLQNQNTNIGLYFLLPKPLKLSAWTPQPIHVWVQIHCSGKSPRPSKGNTQDAKQIPICHLCKSFPTFSNSWCWLLSEPALLSSLLGLLVWHHCCSGCAAVAALHPAGASCLPSIPCIPILQSSAFQKHRGRTVPVQQGAVVEGNLLWHAEALLLPCSSLGLMPFQAKCSNLHSLLSQAFEKIDVLQQDHFTKLFISYSLFDMAFGEARRNGKAQLNILTYSAPMGRQETPSWLLPVFPDCL